MKHFYKYLLTTIFVTVVISFLNIPNHSIKIELPKERAAGTEDNPFGASEYRYEMIKGQADYINPLARRRAIDYTKKHLINHSLKKGESIGNWQALGPGNIGGRIRSIIIRPSNPNHILIGAVAGGIWKSTDGGATWTPKIDDSDPISISCMVNDGDVVYAGTGEGWSNIDAVYGGGIYKSTDFGETWTLLPSTLSNNGWDFKTVRSIRLDSDGNVYAVTRAINYKGGVGGYYTNGGLYKSTDGGSSWTKISPTSLLRYYTGTDVIPVTPTTILFATYAGDMFRTTDNGATWDSVLTGLPTDQETFNRIAMAQDPNNANTVYAVYSARSSSSPYYGLRGIFKTTNGGLTWTELPRPGNLATTGGSYLGGQGWYDNVISVDPHNSNNIYVGGVEDMKSTDGGQHWSQITYWISSSSAHADHHAIVFDPNTADVVYDGNDGGIYKSTNGGTNWTDLNNGLEITQFYGGAVEANGSNYQGGTQDNGHLKYNGSGTSWTEIKGGDGGYAEISQTNSQVAYEEYVYLDISKTTDGGNTWNDAQNGLTDAGDGNVCLFIAPFSMNPENSDVLIAGSDNVWVTTDAAANWSSSSNTLSTGEKVSAVTIVNAAAPYLSFAGTTDGKVFKSTNSTAPAASGGEGLEKTNATWTEITPPGNNGAWVRRITVDLNDKNKIYVCYSGYNNDGVTPSRHVYYSSDQGANWSDISGNLPDVPVHSLVIDNDNPQKLYIGTETGVYETSDRGGTWTKKGSGMPDFAPVDQLVLQSGTNKLFAFTHGRSVFVTDSPLPVELTTFKANINSKKNIELLWETATEVNNYGFEVERKFANEEWSKIGFIEGHGNSNSTKLYSFIDKNISNNRKVYYRLKQLDIDGSFEYSKVVEVIIPLPNNFELSQNYPNPFNPTTTIQYSIPSQQATSQLVQLTVYDALGEKVATLVNKKQQPGNYQINFDASNLSSGIYYYQLKTKNYSQIKKMILLR